MIGVIDYGMGNLRSVVNSLNFLGVPSLISGDPLTLSKCDKLILPGVGAFEDAMNHIRSTNMDSFIKDYVASGKELLGICLGMQLLFDKSYENGVYDGLGLIEGKVVRLDVSLKVPHMGWNDLIIKEQKGLFEGLNNPYVYFVHSYHVVTDEANVLAYVNYEKDIQIAVKHNNVYGLQFHPEKSGSDGLNILSNFAKNGG